MRKFWPPHIVISLPRLLVAGVVIAALFGGLALVHRGDIKASDRSTTHQVKRSSTEETEKPVQKVVWNYDEQAGAWKASGTPPKCADPVFGRSPVDTALATGVLYPGQYRSKNYKPHGGWAFDNSQATDVQVVMPMDAELNGLVRYIESGEIQYKVSFVTECGIAFYFDHLSALAPDFDKIAQTTPEPKVDDTRSDPWTTSYPFKEGDVIATASGHPATHNIAIDFGVLDYRQPNEISKNPQWQALHQTYKPSEWYGVCWFDLLPAADGERSEALPNRDSTKSGVRSDYCANPLGTTLGVNGGNPV